MHSRKPIFLPSLIISAISLFIVLTVDVTAGIVAGLISYGFFFSMNGPIMQTIVTELPGITPAASAGYSLMFEGGSILSFFSPMLLSMLMQSLLLEQAMLSFFVLLVVACGIGFFIKEIGPKAKLKQKITASHQAIGATYGTYSMGTIERNYKPVAKSAPRGRILILIGKQ